MSVYQVQKLLREVQRYENVRNDFFENAEEVIGRYDLTKEEASALLARDYGKLYDMGVHALLLRPFSLLHKVGDDEYLGALRAVRPLRADADTGELV